MTGSLARALACIDCGRSSAPGYQLECPACHGLLELRYDVDRLVRDGPQVFAGAGL